MRASPANRAAASRRPVAVTSSFGSSSPKPSSDTLRATASCSGVCGTEIIGVAVASASMVLPIPMCETKTRACRSTAGCGTWTRTSTFGGTGPSSPLLTRFPTAITTCQGVPAKARRQVR